MRCIVIGAGLGGLCLAQGLKAAGVDVDVYEKDPSIHARFQGFRIGLGELGRDALLSCLPPRLHPVLEATMGDLAGVRLKYDDQLTAIGELAPPADGVVIDRHVLRHLLLAGLDGHVHTGRAYLTHDVLADGRVRVIFADGSTTTGDLLVGADGINSAVRARLSPETLPEDTGVRFVLGRTPLTDRFAGLVTGFGSGISDGLTTLMVGLMRFRQQPRAAAAALAPDVWLPDTTDYLRWVMLGGDPGTGMSPQEAVLKAIDGWHPDVRALVEAADQDNTLQLSIRVVRPGVRWPLGPVTLLGDAIHATSPTGGNGANTALHDADQLRRRLTERGLLDAVDTYEREMFVYGSQAVEHSLAMLPDFLPSAVTYVPIGQDQGPVDPSPED